MTTAITDIQSDKSFKVLHSKLQDFESETAGIIKTAEVNYDELDNLPTHSFAWPEMRKLAMHTKEHTAISMIYANEEDVPNHVKANLEKAAALYEIDLALKPIEKTASEAVFISDDYLLPERKLCKIASINDIELGLEFLKRNGGQIDVMESAHAHKVLCKKASEFNAEVPLYVSQEAGLTLCSIEKVAEWLETRALVAKEETHQEAYTKLATVLGESVISQTPITRNSLLKLASTIAIIDLEAGIDSKYYKSIQTPMRSVFNTEKIAEETVYFGGTNVPLTSFSKLNEDVYAQVLGEDVLEEISTDGQLDQEKLLDIVLSLPADLQQALLPHLNQA